MDKLTQEQIESEWKDAQKRTMFYGRSGFKSRVLDHFESTEKPSEPYIDSFFSRASKGLGINWRKLTQEILDEEFLPLGIQAKIIGSGWLGLVDIEFRKI